jgi:hypothetical protein
LWNHYLYLCRSLLLLKITVKQNHSMTMYLSSPLWMAMFGFETTRWSISPFVRLNFCLD